MNSEVLQMYGLTLTKDEVIFLRQLLNSDGVSVLVKHARLAADVYDKLHDIVLPP